MNIRIKQFTWIVGILLLISCGSDYDRLVRNELASKVDNDSLFLTFRFGETKKEFFARGWKVNSEGKIKQGPKNQTVEYTLTPQDSTSSPIQMLFFPQFTDDDALSVMDVTFAYTAWFPSTKRFYSDHLIMALQDTMMNWYGGNKFIHIQREKPLTDLYVKVDGNRQLTMYIKDDIHVVMKMEDLKVKYKNGI